MHGLLTMPKLRSMFSLHQVTIWRYMSQMRKAGLIKWKGAHKNGGYLLSEKGKAFVERYG
jgi:predicted transcriptional regulator